MISSETGPQGNDSRHYLDAELTSSNAESEKCEDTGTPVGEVYERGLRPHQASAGDFEVLSNKSPMELEPGSKHRYENTFRSTVTQPNLPRLYSDVGLSLLPSQSLLSASGVIIRGLLRNNNGAHSLTNQRSVLSLSEGVVSPACLLVVSALAPSALI